MTSDPIEAAAEAIRIKISGDIFRGELARRLADELARAAIVAYLRARAEPLKDSPVPMAYRLLVDIATEIERGEVGDGH